MEIWTWKKPRLCLKPQRRMIRLLGVILLVGMLSFPQPLSTAGITTRPIHLVMECAPVDVDWPYLKMEARSHWHGGVLHLVQVCGSA